MSQREELFEHIYSEMKGKVWGYLLKKTPSPTDAEDISQQSWVAFANSLNEDLAIKNPKAWLRRIVKNKLADFYQARGRLPPLAGEDADLIERAYHQGDSWRNLLRWPPGLSKLERQIVIRKFVLGQTFSEMADLGKTAKALERIYERLIQKLKERYDKRRKP